MKFNFKFNLCYAFLLQNSKASQGEWEICIYIEQHMKYTLEKNIWTTFMYFAKNLKVQMW